MGGRGFGACLDQKPVAGEDRQLVPVPIAGLDLAPPAS